jgi:hypothetical protein
MKNKDIVKVHEHCWRISCVFKTLYNYEIDFEWIHVADWLLMASGVLKVDIDTVRFDNSAMWDSGVMEYENDRSDVLSNIAMELATFSFIWGGLETIIDIIVPKIDIDKYGKINAACGYLKRNYEVGNVLTGYVDLIDELYNKLGKSFTYKKTLNELNIYNKYNYKSHVNIIGIGIFLVYRVRNLFAHGALEFPEPEEYTNRKTYDEDIINLSSRIVLMTIQMLLITFYEDDNFVVENLYLHADKEYSNIGIADLLKILHVDK